MRTKRSYQAEMAKQNRIYEAGMKAVGSIQVEMTKRGVGPHDHEKIRLHRAIMSEAMKQMDRIHAEAKKDGHNVSSGWHKHAHSTYAQLVRENRD
jgi:hypothetical protein